MDHTQLSRRQLLYGTAGLTIAGLAGCVGAAPTGSTPAPSGDDHPGHGEEAHGHDLVSEPEASREVVVNTARFEDSTEFHFDPHLTWVETGGTVTWRLESGTHTATAYHPGNDQPRLVPEGTMAWDSGTLSEEGETFQHTFETEGVYHYLCVPHEQFGMIATIVVGNPHLEDQTALQVMPENKPEEVHGKLEELNTMVQEAVGGGHHDEGTATEAGHHEGETESDHHHDEETHTDG